MSNGASSPGRKPDLRWIATSKCVVDKRYQRSIESKRSKKLIEGIAARFNWTAFQAVLACPDGKGGYVIIDGQHRVEASRRSQIDEIPAVVVSEASLAQQAAAFVEANRDRVAVNTFQIFHARLVAGEETARAVVKLAKSCGIIIPDYVKPSTALKAGETLAVGTMQNLIRDYAPEPLAIALRAAAAGMADKPGELRAALLQACAKVITSDGDARKITVYLRSLGKLELEKQALRIRVTRGCGSSDAVEFLLRRVLDGRQTNLPAAVAPARLTPLLDHFKKRGDGLTAVNSIFTLFRLNGRRVTLEELQDIASRHGWKAAG